MAISSWPFDGQEVSETQFSLWANMLERSGVQDEADFVVTASSGLVLNIGAGLGLVRGHAVYLTDDDTITLDPASPNPRIDVVVLRLSPTSNSIVPAVVKGTPGTSPSAPELEQTVSGDYDFPLANVLVPGGASVINPSNITDRRVRIQTPLVSTAQITDATPTGRALMRAANQEAARTALGVTSLGAQLMTATSVTQLREILRLFKGTGPETPQTDDLRYRDI